MENHTETIEAPQATAAEREMAYAAEVSFYKGKAETELRFLSNTLGKEPASFRSGSRLTTMRQQAMNVADDMDRLLRHLDEIEGGA